MPLLPWSGVSRAGAARGLSVDCVISDPSCSVDAWNQPEVLPANASYVAVLASLLASKIAERMGHGFASDISG